VDYQLREILLLRWSRGKYLRLSFLIAPIARIETLDGKHKRRVVRDFERAREAAADADNLRARASGATARRADDSQEAFSVAGLPTTWGSRH